MRNIFIGMILVFLNFDITLGSSKIGLIPSFIGYAYMYFGVLELSEYSHKFVKIAPVIKVMAIYTGFMYLIDLLGFSASFEIPFGFGSFLDVGVPLEFILFSVLLGLISTFVSLFISYEIIQGIKDIESVKMKDLNSGQLLSTWKILAVFSLLTFVLLIIPELAIICIIVIVIVDIYYLFVFNKSKNLYYENDENTL
jgi:Archaeal/vacuolar-type H+-ATPase subunit I